MPKAWVDPDDAPELDEAFFRHATPLIDDKPVSPAQYAKAVRRGRPVGSPGFRFVNGLNN